MKRLTIQITFLIFFLFSITPYVAAQTDMSAEQVYEMINRSVVMIVSNDNKGDEDQGSGVVISGSGYIVTCYHLIENSSTLTVVHQNLEFKNAIVVAQDMEKDIAIIKISGANLIPVKIGNSEKLRPGQKVFTISSPVGYENTISEGIISGLRRENTSAALIQSTAPITEGSSGGALVNSQGELIGILSSGQHDGSIYFSIPVGEVMELYASIFEEKKADEVTHKDNFMKEGVRASEEGNYQEAVTLFSKQIENNFNDEGAYFNRGKAYEELREYEQAIKDYTSAIELNPGTGEAYYFRGIAYRHLNDYENAIRDYSSAISINPDYSEALFNRGISYYYLNNYELAVKDYARVIELNPDVANVYYNRGFAYKKSGRLKEALTDFETAAKMNAEYEKSLSPVIAKIKEQIK